MSAASGYAFNRTRRQYLATRLTVAHNPLVTLVGLIGQTASTSAGARGLSNSSL